MKKLISSFLITMLLLSACSSTPSLNIRSDFQEDAIRVVETLESCVSRDSSCQSDIDYSLVKVDRLIDYMEDEESTEEEMVIVDNMILFLELAAEYNYSSNATTSIAYYSEMKKTYEKVSELLNYPTKY